MTIELTDQESQFILNILGQLQLAPADVKARETVDVVQSLIGKLTPKLNGRPDVISDDVLEMTNG